MKIFGVAPLVAAIRGPDDRAFLFAASFLRTNHTSSGPTDPGGLFSHSLGRHESMARHVVGVGL